MGNDTWTEWEDDCRTDRGEVLTGRKRHWCPEWDGLTIDETCPEWPCGCGAERASYDAGPYPTKS